MNTYRRNDEWKKLDMLYNSIYMKFKNRQNLLLWEAVVLTGNGHKGASWKALSYCSGCLYYQFTELDS